MSLLALNSQERKELESLVVPNVLTTEVRRAQALLWLDEGDSPQTVAERLHVSRQTVYNWATRFKRQRGARDVQERLADEKRSGRPGTYPPIIDPLITNVLMREPKEFSYEAHQWNPALLVRYLHEVHQLKVCRASVSLALRRLRRGFEAPQEPVTLQFYGIDV